MIIVPKEKPIIQGLNTYYLDIHKLIEHYQGVIGAGGAFLKSVNAEGVLIFDQDELLNGFFQDKYQKYEGIKAIDKLMEEKVKYNFSISIYKIATEEVYLWSSLPSAEKIYKDLSTEFTDLEGLIKKMSSEKLTGFIDVSINNRIDGGLIFISNGEIIGGSYSFDKGENELSKNRLDILIQKTNDFGGIFQVSRIPMNENIRQTGQAHGEGRAISVDVINILEDFLVIFEKMYTSKKNKKRNFKSVLNQKFIDNAEKFSFLDPFAAEFEYKDRSISFTGDANDREIAEGVITSVLELAKEMNILDEFKKYLTPWVRKYEPKLVELDIQI